jgi:hypothetical protein
MDILYNKKGVPLMMYSENMFSDTFTDAAAKSDFEKRNLLMPHEEWIYSYIPFGDQRVVEWGKGNKFPQFANKTISETTVLNTGLQYLLFLTLGQGLFPCQVTGFDNDGNEVLEPVNDPNLTRFLDSRMCRRYMEKVLRDYFKFGNGAVQFVPGADLKVINGLNPLNSLWYRYTEADAYGNRNAVVSGYWPRIPADDQYDIIPVLNEYNPEVQADLMKFSGKLNKGFIFPVRDSWSNEETYGEPRWWPAYIAGWVDIAHMVPQFLKKAYKNQTTWKWHVQIPYSFWDKKFPVNDFKTTKEREAAINKYMDSVEANLLGPQNAEKPLFTNYAVNEMNGRIEEEWKINALDNKYTGNDNLVTSSAANSEILFSMMVNPNVMGAGMPGGSYSMQSGGSNIREAFLVNIANAWKDRQNLLDPLELYIKMNGLPECQLRFRNTILTTLDTGAGTQKTLS